MSFFRKFATRYAQFKVIRQERDAIATKTIGNLLAEELFTPASPNYIEMRFEDADDPSRQVVVNARRLDGKTPHELRRDAEQEAERLRIVLSQFVRLANNQHVLIAGDVAWLKVRTLNEGIKSIPVRLDGEVLEAVQIDQEQRELALNAARELMK